LGCPDGRDVAGIRFFEHVNLALEYLDAAVESAGIAGRVERGSLKIGIFSSLASGFLPELLRCYSARHPEIEVNIVEGSPRGIDLAAHELLPGLIDRVQAATPRGADEIASIAVRAKLRADAEQGRERRRLQLLGREIALVLSAFPCAGP
jgi:DNA-binding transcriptional LysR family regulator